VAGAINTLRITQQLRAANERNQHQIDVIADIQRSLLPEGPFDVPGLNIGASYQTFDTAGGDMYDILPLARGAGEDQSLDNRWALFIADVSGHGAAAAVVMAMLHAILHAYTSRPSGPAQVLGHLNRHLCDKRIQQSFVTAFLAFYDPARRGLSYARAGHNPPIVKAFPHRGDPIRLDDVGEIPLGIDPHIRYTDGAIRLESGQTLILYTDGVTEARVPGGEMFGVDGVERSLIHCSGAPQCAIDHITAALKAHQTGVRPNDDQTIVAAQVK
jgi:sigma-B regulation protein RsbU (phosphoserine phosphatase)